MRVGYARVSGSEQSLRRQVETLRRVGCEKVFRDVTGSNQAARPGLTDALEVLHARDVLVVCKLDRVGRSLGHLIDLLRHLDDRRVEFCSLEESIYTAERGVSHVLTVLAQFDRELAKVKKPPSETKARRRRGGGGRPRALDEKKLAQARRLYKEGVISTREICSTLGISKATLYRYVSVRRNPQSGKAGSHSHKGRSSPAKGRSSPAKGRSSPAKGRSSPAKGRSSSAKSRSKPGRRDEE